jgi:multicomponent Na+:H+ antiporter subunit G
MNIRDIVGIVMILLGVPFFLAGTIGLLRLPDVFTRSHALTKADNLGLGLIVIGLIVQAEVWTSALKLFLTWILVLISSAGVCHIVANTAARRGIKIWKKP